MKSNSKLLKKNRKSIGSLGAAILTLALLGSQPACGVKAPPVAPDPLPVPPSAAAESAPPASNQQASTLPSPLPGMSGSENTQARAKESKQNKRRKKKKANQ